VAVRVIVVAAVYRAVLEPARPGFAYLRIGRREGWLLLLMLTLAILVACAIIPLELLMIVPVIALARAAAPALLVGGGGVLVGLAVLVWVLARLSMAAPMTFAERRFRLFESWRLTRGHGLALIALGLLVFLFAALVEVAIFALAAAVAVGFVGWPMNFRTVLVGLNSLRLQGPEALAVWLVPIGLVAAAAFGALYAIVVAPWADVYAQLNGRPDSRA
jgi:hypothetical protein